MNTSDLLMRRLIEQQQMQTLVLLTLIDQLPPTYRASFAASLRTRVAAYMEAPLCGASDQTDALLTGLLAMYLEAAGQAPSLG